MAEFSSIPCLTDIVEAAELIRSEMAGVSLQAFEPDRRKRWIVERGIEIISEASLRLPDALKARHPAIPWRKVAGIGNVLRHNYEQVAYDVLWHVVHSDLLDLERVCREELARASVSVRDVRSRMATGIADTSGGTCAALCHCRVFMVATPLAGAYFAGMDQAHTAPADLPGGWAASLARGEADLAAGRVHAIDTDELCREIEAEAADSERQIAVRHASPA